LNVNEDDSNEEEALTQSGQGVEEKRTQKRKHEILDDNDFIVKVASIVKEQLHPQITNPVSTVWRNFDLNAPTTSRIAAENTVAPLHFNSEIKKNDRNDSYGT
jgi:hypothetical protein